MINDAIRRSFLERQFTAGAELVAHSDVVSLEPLAGPMGPPSRYIARFHCQGVLQNDAGQVYVAPAEFVVGIAFGADHMRRVDPMRIVTWLAPTNVFHANVRPPVSCLGHVFPGIELVDLLFAAFEIITWHNWASDDALNEEAAAWARRHQDLLPVDRRTLRRRLQSTGNGGQGGEA